MRTPIKMKKELRPALAKNITKARKAKRWSQYKAASMLGISRQKLASYEEGRATFLASQLPMFAQILGVTNLISFLENPDFDPRNQEKEYIISCLTPLEMRYEKADERSRQIVDIALGIGKEMVTC